MKKVKTVSLETVKACVRRGEPGRVTCSGGWSVFEQGGESRYVIDEETGEPVPWKSLQPSYGAQVTSIGTTRYQLEL